MSKYVCVDVPLTRVYRICYITIDIFLAGETTVKQQNLSGAIELVFHHVT